MICFVNLDLEDTNNERKDSIFFRSGSIMTRRTSRRAPTVSELLPSWIAFENCFENV